AEVAEAARRSAAAAAGAPAAASEPVRTAAAERVVAAGLHAAERALVLLVPVVAEAGLLVERSRPAAVLRAAQQVLEREGKIRGVGVPQRNDVGAHRLRGILV